MSRKYRFFYHYNKHAGEMTVHYRGTCIPVKNVKCEVPCNTKWNRIQPHIVMQGFAEDIEVNTDSNTAIIR